MGCSDDNECSFETTSSMEILASVFFVVAGTWLIIAILYSALVLWFLRLRARGELDRVYEPEFGRIRLCCGLSLSLGCLLRRYVAHLQMAENDQQPHQHPSLTRDERRAVMERLLDHVKVVDPQKRNTVGPFPNEEGVPSEEEVVCSICLGEYDEEAPAIQSPTCSHCFHKECLLDWLQGPSIVECPCCRKPLVHEDEVYATARKMRKERRKRRKQQEHDHTDRTTEDDVLLYPTESSSPPSSEEQVSSSDESSSSVPSSSSSDEGSSSVCAEERV